MNNEKMRLQRFLARGGVASRRACEVLISEGKVSVNGVVITEPGTKVDPQTDEVLINGEVITLPEQEITIMLNKPKGYATTMSDAHAEHTVKELIPKDRFPSLYPIGRLDVDTSGLLLFTTNGDLGNALLHPKHHVDKTYVATIEGVLSTDDIKTLEAGIVLDDGPCAPAKITVLSSESGYSVVEIIIHEGRKRQVRRMFKTLGHPVMELTRTRFANLELGDLELGDMRPLSDKEFDSLKAMAGI